MVIAPVPPYFNVGNRICTPNMCDCPPRTNGKNLAPLQDARATPTLKGGGLGGVQGYGADVFMPSMM